jgi:dTDP-glucose 4,6-dehydratase
LRILITGSCGFIGSAVVRRAISLGHNVITLDKLTYAASEEALEAAATDPRHTLLVADITDAEAVRAAFTAHKPDRVMHLAAETHVDRSIDGPAAFVQTNIVGTFVLLQEALSYWRGLDPAKQAAFRFHHVSTDEVFGALGESDPPFSETTPYDPRSPYSASKAASDHLARAWFHTYGLPVVVSNTTNNYGPWQFPEKLIPLTIINALLGRELPVYGQGLNTRDWLHVEDHADALLRVIEHGRPGATYCIGARSPRRNIDVVTAICERLDAIEPDPAGARTRLIRYVTDRPGHDHRYEIAPDLAEAELGWKPARSFEQGLAETIQWYRAHRPWWEAIRQSRYSGERLGSATTAEKAA